MTLLEAEGLTRHFGGVAAVDDVDLRVQRGEVRALIGPNGAGKSTLVGLICGRSRPTAGHIRLDGRDITDQPAHARVRLGIAYSFQITSIYPRLSVFDNAALAVQSRLGGRARTLAAETRTALDRLGLADHAGELAGQMSYGHQRLLEVVMGLALRPKLLILDEPTHGLAAGDIAQVARVVRETAQEGTVLLIEHNMDVVMDLADRITVMASGKILAEGTPAEIRADPAVQFAYLGR